MIQMIAGIVLTATMAAYSTILYGIVLKERDHDRLELHGLFDDLRGDLDALLEHLGLEITRGEPDVEVEPEVEAEPEPEVEPVSEDDTPTGPIPIVPATEPMERVWDKAAAELVAKAEIQTVERTVNGFTFRVREEA